MSKRTLIRAFRVAAPPAAAPSAGVPFTIRSFSSSSRSQAVHFSKTSSPELDARLDDIFTRIILPTHLSPTNRRRLHDPKHKDTLKMNPIVLEIEDVEHRFSQHMDVFDPTISSNTEIMNSVLPLMTSRADWANLVTLLAGLQRARAQPAPLGLGTNHKLKIVRAAGRAGHIHTVIACAQQSARTGFFLTDVEVVSSLLYWVMRRALDANWEAGATAQALTWAEEVMDLLERDAHVEVGAKKQRRRDEAWARRNEAAQAGDQAGGKAEAQGPRIPLHRDPLILAQMTHLASAKALHAPSEGTDAADKATQYAQLVTRVWPSGKALLDVYPPHEYQYRMGRKFLLAGRTSYLNPACAALAAFELTPQVVADAKLAEQLRTTATALRSEVEGILARDGTKSVAGAETYNKLFGTKAE